jgi:uncharacterized protein YukJ
MSARHLPLFPNLQLAWELGALSFKEAWELQDQALLAPSNLVPVPLSLEPQLDKLNLFQQPAANKLPL